MLKHRKHLELELEYIKQDIYRKRQISDIVESAHSQLSAHFTLGKLTGIFNNRYPLIQLSEQELFYITQFLSPFYSQLNVEDWFLPSEISEWVEAEDYVTRDNGLIELENVMYNGDKLNPEYLCYIKYKDLAELANSGKLEYDTNLQRSPKLVTKLGRTIEIPTVNRESVAAISEKMSTGGFMANQITLNMLRENKPFHFYSNGKLTIDSTQGKCLIIDGFHRITALSRCMRLHPNTQGVLVLNIKNLDAEEVRAFIYQESLANRHEEATVGKFDFNNKITVFTNKLNNYMNRDYNFFYHRIKTGIIPNGDLMNEDLFREGLSLSKLDTIINQEEVNLLDFNYFFCNFFQVVESHIRHSLKEESDKLLADPTFIIGLMVVVHEFYTKGVGDDKIFDLINALDLKHQSEHYVFKLPLNKNTRAKIKQLYLQKVREVLQDGSQKRN